MRRDLLGAGSRGCPIRKAWRPGTRPWATSRASAARRSRGSATGIDEGAGEFLTRPLDHTWFLYVFVRRHPPGRESGPAGGLPSPGGRHRRVGPGAPGDPGTWPWGTPRPPTSGSAFLRSLRERGLKVPSPHDPEGVVLVTSDAPSGIRAAVKAILPGAARTALPGPASPATSPPGLGSVRPRAGQCAGLDHLRPHQSRGGDGPVQARRRLPSGGLLECLAFFGLWFLVVSGCLFPAVQLVFGLVGGAVPQCRMESRMIIGQFDPRGNIFDGLFPCGVHHGRGRVRSPGVALKDLRPGIVPAHAGSPDGGEDLVVLQMFGELL